MKAAETALEILDGCSEFSAAETILQQIAALRAAACSLDLARKSAEQLLGCYPERKIVNAEIYSAAMLRVLMEYPAAMVRRVVDPVRGLQSTLTFFPSVADVSKALAVMNARVQALGVQANRELYRRQQLLPVEEGPGKLKTEDERKSYVMSLLGPKGGGADVSKYEPKCAAELRTPARPASAELKASLQSSGGESGEADPQLP